MMTIQCLFLQHYVSRIHKLLQHSPKTLRVREYFKGHWLRDIIIAHHSVYQIGLSTTLVMHQKCEGEIGKLGRWQDRLKRDRETETMCEKICIWKVLLRKKRHITRSDCSSYKIRPRDLTSSKEVWDIVRGQPCHLVCALQCFGIYFVYNTELMNLKRLHWA